MTDAIAGDNAGKTDVNRSVVLMNETGGCGRSQRTPALEGTKWTRCSPTRPNRRPPECERRLTVLPGTDDELRHGLNELLGPFMLVGEGE